MAVLVIRTEEDGLGLGLEDAVEGEALLEVVDVETKAEVEVEVERGSVGMTLSCKAAEVLADATWPLRAAMSALIDVGGPTLKCELGYAVDQIEREIGSVIR